MPFRWSLHLALFGTAAGFAKPGIVAHRSAVVLSDAKRSVSDLVGNQHGGKYAFDESRRGAASGADYSSKKPIAVAADDAWAEPALERARAAPPGELERSSDVVGNEETISKLRAVVAGGNMPNIILSGPPGTGKTTSMLCLAREMLGANYKEAVLEMNASDERGIMVVRDKIKMFAKKKVNLPPGAHKLVILDEADSMTAAAQQAMRRTMELFSGTTRDKELLKRLTHVCGAEGVAATDGGLEALIFTAEGDMRNALNNLQSTHSGFGAVDEQSVFKVCDQPHPHVARKILDDCAKRDLDAAVAGIAGLHATGYAAVDIVATLFKVIKMHPMPEADQLKVIKEIGFAHTRVIDGCATLTQLTGLVARLTQLD
ncbi:hypothetical protein JL721_5781 [Aureococcus anophagefferens]|nr:hypothetical protein JL721_5781 [Aureococcus anophagefferens]